MNKTDMKSYAIVLVVVALGNCIAAIIEIALGM
jgi:hypothetical protein